MPTPLKLPYPPLVCFPSDKPIKWRQLEAKIRRRLSDGVSICIVAEEGPDDRGGYFFHIRQTGAGYTFRTFDRANVLTLETGDECAAFINHVSGRQYSEKMWGIAQGVNLRADEEAAGEPDAGGEEEEDQD